MMRIPFVAGNWKMNTSLAEAKQLVAQLIPLVADLKNVHMAVWLWFYGAKPQHTVDHIDRDKRNNRIWNLRDVDMFDQNRNNSNTKLTVADVKLIKQRLRNGELQRVIAADYNIGKGAINDIDCGRNWANVA